MQARAQRVHFTAEWDGVSLIYVCVACALIFGFVRTACAAESDDVNGARLAASATLLERRTADPHISLADVEEEVQGIARVS